MIVWLIIFGGLAILLTLPPQLFGLIVGWMVERWARHRGRKRCKP